jgi:hypothetical protein
MIFFTDVTTTASHYCLCNIKRYQHLSDPKKIIFLDPSVYELKHNDEYSHYNKLHQKVQNCEQNEFISIDYPCDMNLQYAAQFIQKTNENNRRYASNPHYINTIQCRFLDYLSFVENYLLNQDIFSDNPQKIVGIGNLCRINRYKSGSEKENFLIQVFSFLDSHSHDFSWIHFYGPSFKVIKQFILPFEQSHPEITISIDSTKWTRAVDNAFKQQHGKSCSKKNRNLFFIYYIEKIQQSTSILIQF